MNTNEVTDEEVFAALTAHHLSHTRTAYADMKRTLEQFVSSSLAAPTGEVTDAQIDAIWEAMPEWTDGVHYRDQRKFAREVLAAAPTGEVTDAQIDAIWEAMPEWTDGVHYRDQRKFAREVLAAAPTGEVRPAPLLDAFDFTEWSNSVWSAMRTLSLQDDYDLVKAMNIHTVRRFCEASWMALTSTSGKESTQRILAAPLPGGEVTLPRELLERAMNVLDERAEYDPTYEPDTQPLNEAGHVLNAVRARLSSAARPLAAIQPSAASDAAKANDDLIRLGRSAGK